MKEKLINVTGRLWNKLDLPNLGNIRFNILAGVYRIFPLLGGINYPRLIEWQFVIKNLPKPPAKILDVGSTTSLFPFKLKALGYETYCFDQRLPNFKLPKSIIFQQQNLLELHIDSNTFDAISCISVIEHVGMGKYGDPKYPEESGERADERAIKEMLRILKSNGYLIITTNVSKCTYVYNNERRYGKEILQKLMSLGKISGSEYRYFNGRRWLICDENKAFDQDADNFGIAMFVLRK